MFTRTIWWTYKKKCIARSKIVAHCGIKRSRKLNDVINKKEIMMVFSKAENEEPTGTRRIDGFEPEGANAPANLLCLTT